MKYRFVKDTEYVLVSDQKIEISFIRNVEKKENAYSAEIPSLNIFFYTKTKKEIEESTHESIESFFNYWLKEKGDRAFLDHMLNLGFDLKPCCPKVKPKLAKPTAQERFLLWQ